jgi:hypothetical protein
VCERERKKGGEGEMNIRRERESAHALAARSPRRRLGKSAASHVIDLLQGWEGGCRRVHLAGPGWRRLPKIMLVPHTQFSRQVLRHNDHPNCVLSTDTEAPRRKLGKSAALVPHVIDLLWGGGGRRRVHLPGLGWRPLPSNSNHVKV